MRTTMLCLAIAALAAIPARLPAQSPDRLPAGTVVRWQDGTATRFGHLMATSPADGPLTVRARGERVDRQLGLDTPGLEFQVRKGRKGRSALIGLGVGAVVGVLAGFAAGDDKCGEGLFGCLFTFTAEQKAGMLGAGLGGIGALVGAISAPGARWEAPGGGSPRRIALHLGRDRIGLRVGF